MFVKSAIAATLLVLTTAKCGEPTYKETKGHYGLYKATLRFAEMGGIFRNWTRAQMEKKCDSTPGCKGFTYNINTYGWHKGAFNQLLSGSNPGPATYEGQNVYSWTAAVPCPKKAKTAKSTFAEIEHSFTASLLNADAWASYKAANSAHVSASAGLRLKRTEAVKAYFAAKTKAASAASALADATTAQTTAQGNFNDASTATATAKGIWNNAVTASGNAKAAASAAVTKQGEVEKTQESKIAAVKLAGETAVAAATAEATKATAASIEAKKGAAAALVTFNAAKATKTEKGSIKDNADATFTSAKKASEDATTKAASDKSAAMLAHKNFITGWKSSHTTGNF